MGCSGTPTMSNIENRMTNRRAKLPSNLAASILLRSARRCCLCFGLHLDETVKSGQIAHLDHDANNHTDGNLAFLCLQHHDEYDSSTSQSKGLSIKEVKAYRQALYCWNDDRQLTRRKTRTVDDRSLMLRNSLDAFRKRLKDFTATHYPSDALSL